MQFECLILVETRVRKQRSFLVCDVKLLPKKQRMKKFETEVLNGEVLNKELLAWFSGYYGNN